MGLVFFVLISAYIGFDAAPRGPLQYNEIRTSVVPEEEYILVDTFGDYHLIARVIKNECSDKYRLTKEYCYVQIGSPEIIYTADLLEIEKTD